MDKTPIPSALSADMQLLWVTIDVAVHLATQNEIKDFGTIILHEIWFHSESDHSVIRFDGYGAFQELQTTTNDKQGWRHDKVGNL